jgi:hypothetical protein
MVNGSRSGERAFPKSKWEHGLHRNRLADDTLNDIMLIAMNRDLAADICEWHLRGDEEHQWTLTAISAF